MDFKPAGLASLLIGLTPLHAAEIDSIFLVLVLSRLFEAFGPVENAAKKAERGDPARKWGRQSTCIFFSRLRDFSH